MQFLWQKDSAKGNLKTHIRIHTKERPYKCYFENCFKTFKTKGQLQNYLKSHSYNRPYTCGNFYLSFKRKYELDCNQKTHDPVRIRSFTCDYLKMYLSLHYKD
jgi:uncharacterized Zn-finger protein